MCVRSDCGQSHRRRSGWTSGETHGEHRRWVRAEWGEVWGGVSPLQPTKGSGGASWGPPAGSGARRKRILAYFEGDRTLIFVPIWQNLGEGTICISVPPLQILGGGTCPLFPPWSTPMDKASKQRTAVKIIVISMTNVWMNEWLWYYDIACLIYRVTCAVWLGNCKRSVCPFVLRSFGCVMVWYGMVNVDLYSASSQKSLMRCAR